MDGGRRVPTRRRGERALAGVAGALALGVAALTPVAGAARTVDALGGRTFVVNSTGDDPDGSTGDGVCAVAGAPGRCTLRAAIEQANASGGHDRIEFAIPGAGPHTLRPRTRYPIISDPAGLTIDGYTQPGSRVNTAAHGSNADIRIELRGRGPTDIDGLYVISADNVIRGLAMYDFRRTLYLRTAGAVGNEIVGNFIGTDAAGTFGRSSRVINDNGVHLERGASDNRIGMPGSANRNVISGNGDRGVALYDPGTDRNRIRNNVIGLSPTGSRLRNWGHGIDINYDPSFNVIGGRSVGEGNVLSGNELSGVEISHDRRPGSTTGNQVIGNLIGTSVDGSRGDDQYRNREFGVNLEGNGACVYTCPPDINDNLVEANRIVGSSAGVMIWKGAHDNVVRNNVIGLLPDGTVAPSASSTLWGVLIETGAFDNLIDSNTIAGGRDGIQVRPDNDYTDLTINLDFPTFGNTFRRNAIWGVTSGLGIDIAPIGVANTAPAQLDADVQGGLRPPVITAATEDRVTVSTCNGCRVELFATDVIAPTAHGLGRIFLADAVAGSTGVATFALRRSTADPLVVRRNDRITATSTDPGGNTSEFSLRVAVGSGSVEPPPPAPARYAPATRCRPAC